MCCRISFSGSFSNAERLISSIKRRCSRTLASSSLSLSSGLALADCAVSGAVSGSGNTVQEMPSSVDDATSSAAGARSGAGTLRALKRPSMLAERFMGLPVCFSMASTRPGKREFLACRRAGTGGLARGRRRNQLLKLQRYLVPLLHLLERYSAIDCLAHEPVVIWNHRGEGIAQCLFDIRPPQPGAKHLLLEPIHDDLRVRSIA